MRHRYAALLAESNACAKRRANPSLHARPSATSLYSSTDPSSSSARSSSGGDNRAYPSGSGALTHMDGAVSSCMPLKDDHVSDSKHLEENRKNPHKGSGVVGADPIGNKMYIDASSVSINAEYDDNIGDIGDARDGGDGGDDGLGADRSDSSCWRPELPPSALLEYLRIIASKRLHADAILLQESREGDKDSHQQDKNEDGDEGDEEEDAIGKEYIDSMALSLSSSALAAVGILVEELTRECMTSWRRKHSEAIKNLENEKKNERKNERKKKRKNREERAEQNTRNETASPSSSSRNIKNTKNIHKIDDINDIGKAVTVNSSKKRNIDDHDRVLVTGPLGPPTKRNVRIEARLQLQGANFKPAEDAEEHSEKHYAEECSGSSSGYITPALLRNRLEVLFGQDLTPFGPQISLLFLQESLRYRVGREDF